LQWRSPGIVMIGNSGEGSQSTYCAWDLVKSAGRIPRLTQPQLTSCCETGLPCFRYLVWLKARQDCRTHKSRQIQSTSPWLYIHSPNLTNVLRNSHQSLALGHRQKGRRTCQKAHKSCFLGWKTPPVGKQLGSLLSDLLVEEVVAKLLVYLECSDYPLHRQ